MTTASGSRMRLKIGSPFFFSFLNGTLDVAVTGEVGGVLGVEGDDGEGTPLGSAGVGRLFSTSADMASFTGRAACGKGRGKRR